MNQEELDKKYIDIAIDISKKTKYPYGAIIVKDSKIIGRSDVDNYINKTMFNHAELVAIEDACGNDLNLYKQLEGSTIYCSCEPCMMCMGAIIYEGISRLVYSCRIEDSDKYIVKEVLAKTKNLAKEARSNIEVISDYERDKALEIMSNYKF